VGVGVRAGGATWESFSDEAEEEPGFGADMSEAETRAVVEVTILAEAPEEPETEHIVVGSCELDKVPEDSPGVGGGISF